MGSLGVQIQHVVSQVILKRKKYTFFQFTVFRQVLKFGGGGQKDSLFCYDTVKYTRILMSKFVFC